MTLVRSWTSLLRAVGRSLLLAVPAIAAGCSLRPLAAAPAGPPAAFAEPSTGMEFVRVVGGTLAWGQPTGDSPWPAGRAATVEVGEFYLGRTEVTQAQWRAVMGAVPSWFRGAGRPVDQVSWDDAREFARRLSGLSGRRLRLPTEAEWEFAARGGGLEQAWPGTADGTSVGEFAWFRGNSDGATHEVAGRRPNGLGLFDLGGNVWEWCEDRYVLAAESSQDDGYRVLRGGSWDDTLERVTATYRLAFDRSWVGRTVGFRLAADGPE